MVIPIPKRRASQDPTTTPGDNHVHCWYFIKMHSDANMEMKSRVSCFSSLLNFTSNELTHIN